MFAQRFAPQLIGEPTASLSIQKVSTATTVTPGQLFDYQIQFQCTAGTVSGCVNAALNDTMPPYLAIIGTPTVTGTSNYTTAGTTTTDLVVTFTDDLGGGAVGLAPGNVVTVQVSVRVDPSAPTSADGQVLTNTASIAADNAATKESSAAVTLNVPTTLGATTTKTITPEGGNNNTTDTTTATITGTNTSNAPVSRLIIDDPTLQVDGTPPTQDNPFQYLRITQLNGVTPPAGADTVQLRVYDSSVAPSGAWVDGPVITLPGDPELPATVDPANITGTQLIFTDTSGDGIPPGASAGISVQLALRDIIPDDQLPVVIANAADTTVVGTDGSSFTSEPATATYRVPPSTLSVSAGKSFDPRTVHAGDPTTVTVTGTNTSDETLDTMTITEPAAGTANHFEDGAWTFTSTGSPAGSGIVWPTGATAATITYDCDGSAGTPQTTTTIDTLPAPDASCDPVTGFTATFTGALAPGAEATIPFAITTNPDQPLVDMLRTNTVGVHGASGSSSGDDAASAVIRTIKDRIAVDVSKSIYPSQIPAYPGEIVTVQLSGSLKPFPDSTTDATTLVVQDPADFASDEWYKSFNPSAVTATPIPACSTLTVQYTTDAGGTWNDVPGMSAVPGARIFNAPFPDDVRTEANGIRFVYEALPADGTCSGGFPPGFAVSPNIVYSLDQVASRLDGPGGPNQTVTDCASSGATSPTTPPAAAGPACDDVVLVPVDPGTIDPIDKSWDIPSVPERSQAQAGATISWSTDGFTGTGRIDITDTQTPTDPLPSTVFDTFDLVSIPAITPQMDPLLTYDQVAKVQLFQLPAGSLDPLQGQWVDAPNDPCPAQCDGTFPGYTLSAADRAVTIGFRLSFVESPTRADRIDSPTAPPVGSGVAASTGNNRQIKALFQLRDVRRSDAGIPVVAGAIYNTADAGVVANTVRLDPYWNVDDTDPIITRTDSATILITNVDITADATKTWTGGPMGIPEAGVPQSAYPTGRISLNVSNTSPSKVDVISVTDPDLGDHGSTTCTTAPSDPFDTFNLVGFRLITAPSDIGATDVTIELTPAIGGQTVFTRSQALALTEAQLVDVTSLTITYTGRINAATPTVTPTATVIYDVRLRETSRSAGTPPQPGASICNQAHSSVADMVDFPGYTDQEDVYRQAEMNLIAQSLGVTAGKSFSPTSIQEPSRGPVDVTLSGQPSGASRTVAMTLEDTRATFFNQYDFTQFQPVTWVAPVNRVRADVYVGGTWSLVGGVPVVTGGHWVNGNTVSAPTTALSLPAGVVASDVQGVRFTFDRSDGANWENPVTPTQTGVFQVTRRDELHTGGPVPSDLQGNQPAPGETVAGQATNTTTATVTSSDVDANGVPLTASSSADATLLYRHATNSVQARKTPNGSNVSPGAPFTYTLTFVNTGGIAIANPVITDVYPADASGPQISLAPVPNFTYTIAGGTGMPTDPAAVTVASSDTGLVFTFPAGSSLPIGATYTITYQAVTRAGLPAGTSFTNRAGITGDRPWDACDGAAGGGIDAQTGECFTVATNTVTSAGAVGVVKRVKAAGSDALGVEIDPLWQFAPPPCTPDADGFYSRPCIPVAQPGGDIDWKLDFVNIGNLPINRVLGIDRLPAPGDAVSSAPSLPRLSDWRPLLSGERPSLLAGAGTLNVFYTTATSGWCDGPQAADGQLLCPALNWQEWPADQALPVAPGTVTGIQVEFLPETPLPPAAKVSVDLPMKAPAYSPADVPNTTGLTPDDSYAFNSAGTAARYVAGDIAHYTLTTEPPRVGVGLAHGGVRLVKLVTGDAADRYAPSTFQVSVSCVSAGEAIPIPSQVAVQTVSANVPLTIYNLPYHATCSLVEGDNGQSSPPISVSTVVQRDPTESVIGTLTNDYEFASLSVTKSVASQAVDENGVPIPYGPFRVTVDCTFLGAPVYAAGYSEGNPMTADLSNGQTATFTELPATASCTITETDAKGAPSTSIETTVAGQSTTTGSATQTIELAPDVGGNPANSAVVTNAFDDGTLHLVKDVTGDVAETYGAGPFVLHVECTLDDASGVRNAWTGDVTLGGDNPLNADIAHIATGAECEVTETNDGGATSVSISPSDGVTIGVDSTVTVTATNSFDPGRILVDKVVDGDAASFAPDSFPIEVTCRANGAVLPGFPVTVDVTPGTPASIDTLAGSDCVAVETDTGMATTVTYDPASDDDGGGSGEVTATPTEDETTPTITVTNTYEAGALQIVKQIQGTGAGSATRPFVFSVVCAFNDDSRAFTDTVTLQPTNAGQTLISAPIAPLPVGAVCTVSETDNGGADSTPPPVTVTIRGAAVERIATATLVNTFTAPLPATGGPAPAWWLIWVAAGLVVLGLVILLVLRRRRSG